MQITLSTKDELLNFLLNTEEFNEWNISKLELSNIYSTITTNPVYYQYNTKQYMKFGDRFSNPYCHLQKIDTKDDMNKTTSQYSAALNYSTINTTTQVRHYPREIIERFLLNTSQQDRYTMDIKLIYPHSMKKLFDYEDQFDNFYIDFYCTTSSQGVIFTYTEKIKDFSLTPPEEWLTYCYDLFIKSQGKNKLA